MAFGKREGSLLHGCQCVHRPGSDDDDDDLSSPVGESDWHPCCFFRLVTFYVHAEGVELIETESRIHT